MFDAVLVLRADVAALKFTTVVVELKYRTLSPAESLRLTALPPRCIDDSPAARWRMMHDGCTLRSCEHRDKTQWRLVHMYVCTVHRVAGDDSVRQSTRGHRSTSLPSSTIRTSCDWVHVTYDKIHQWHAIRLLLGSWSPLFQFEILHSRHRHHTYARTTRIIVPVLNRLGLRST